MTGRLRRPTTPLTLADLDERLKDLERRSGTRAVDLRSVPRPEPAAASRAAEIIVAAFDSSDAAKAGADYVCTGSGDDVIIQAALDELDGFSWIGKVVLLAGGYITDSPLSLPPFSVLEGMGLSYIESTSGPVIGSVGNYARISRVELAPDSGYAIDAHSASGVRITDVTMDGPINPGSQAIVMGSTLRSVDVTTFATLFVGCFIQGTLALSAASGQVRVGNCVFGGAYDPLLSMDGQDHAVDACTFYGFGPTSDTSSVVTIDGDRNSFTNNQVRSNGLAGVSDPKYGVEVLAGAAGARVKFNDLRPGANPWGTAAYVDAGTGTLASDNDS